MLTLLPPELLLEISHHLPLPDLTALLATSSSLSATLLAASPNVLFAPRESSTLHHYSTLFPHLLKTLPIPVSSPRDTITGHTPLHFAATHNAVPGLMLHLQRATDPSRVISERDFSGLTPLETAAKSGSSTIVNTLLNAGASAGRSAELAAGAGSINVLNVLKDHSVSLSSGDIAVAAAEAGKTEVLEIEDVDVEGVDGMGTPAIVAAAKRGNVEAVKCLLNRGAKVDAVDTYGWTALHWGVYEGRKEVVGVLVEHGADTGKETDDGMRCGELAEWWDGWKKGKL